MQPFLAIATLVAALAVAVNTETAYILAPVTPRILQTGWGWRPVKTISLALPSISKGWGWKRPLPKGITIGVYGGIKIGPKQEQGWGWKPAPPKKGWGWEPPKKQGWGWEPPKQQGWGWQKPQKGWGWGGGDEDEEEDDYRGLYDDAVDASSEEAYDDDASGSEESAEDDSAEDDSPFYDLSNTLGYEPVYYNPQ